MKPGNPRMGGANFRQESILEDKRTCNRQNECAAFSRFGEAFLITYSKS